MDVTTTYGEVDPLHGTACEAWQVQIGLGAEAGLVAAQAGLAGSGHALHLMPPDALHITVLPLIDVGERLSAPAAAVWRRHGDAWQRAIAEACRVTPRFDVCFGRLRAFPRAIVALDEANPLAAFRARLAGPCGLPERPARVPGITHAALARFRHAAAVSLPAALEARVSVRSVRLVRETIYPTLAFDTVASFMLT